MTTVQVRYIVRDVDAAIAFYTSHLGFQLVMHPAAAFAMLSRGDLRLVLSAPNPAGGGGQSMPDGTKPEPGGWNRFAIQVDDLAATVATLRAAGAHFRNEIVTGVGGKQILVEDPSGNPIELFEPLIAEAQRAHAWLVLEAGNEVVARIVRRSREREITFYEILDRRVDDDPQGARADSRKLGLPSGPQIAHRTRDRLADRV